MSSELTDTERFLHDLTKVNSLEEVWKQLQVQLAKFGFDRLFYAATRVRTDHSAGDVRDAFILTNYPESFTVPYLDGGLFRNAPMVRWAMENVGSISWGVFADAAKRGELSAETMEVVLFNLRHGIIAGYGISFPRLSSRNGHGLGLASMELDQAELDRVWDAHGPHIELIAHVAHLKLMSLPQDLHGRSLTPRQREVLELVADGKTIQDVAVLMQRTPATVEKHLRLARDALAVETTAQAILKMGVQNQFFRYEA